MLRALRNSPSWKMASIACSHARTVSSPALFEFALLKGSTESVTLNLVAGADKKLYFEDPAEEQRAIQFLRQGLDTAKQNKYEEAEKLFSQALEINPSSVETLYFYGAASMTAEKFDRAVELLNQAVKDFGCPEDLTVGCGCQSESV